MTSAVERLRATVCCLLLTALVFAQDAGLVVPDTKLDLTAAPAGLLERALHLWDPLGGAGQVQNQGYGYLFPMGPSFLALQAAGLPDWAVQRSWQSLVLVTAFLGVRALAARLELGTPGTRLLAAAVYALSPRVLSQLGAASVEVLPYALAPWVLVPLVTGAVRGSPRLAAARSGVAVLLVGGVNAAATLAVLPLGVLWLALCEPGARRRRLAAWWALSVSLATAWWVVPLLLLGRYSPPFLDVIEGASTTTGVTGLWSVLTGNDLWQQYLSTGAGPARPGGFLLVTVPALVLCTTALSVVGLVGLLRRSTPHRGFLVGGVLLGLLLVGAGHTGALGRPLGGVERELLDGVLAPFRNVHKYDLLLRLPLALGVAQAAAVVVRRRTEPRAGLPARVQAATARPAAFLAAIALVGSTAPALGSLEPAGAYTALPAYWSEVAAFLEQAASGPAGGRALVVPASSTGTYAWGRPGDEPLQALARTPYLVRDAVPLGGPGITRVLDVVEEELAGGRGSPALAVLLARSGVRHLVVRNDLDVVVAGSTRLVLVHAALAGSPGLTRVAAFGPPVGAGFGTGQVLYDANLQPTYPAVEVFEVASGAGQDSLVSVVPTSGTLRVAGGPESLLSLLEGGALGRRTPVRLVGEAPVQGEPAGLPTVTDGYREREVDIGRATDAASATRAPGAPRRLDRPVSDYLPLPPRGRRTVVGSSGFTQVTASSSAADADAVVARGRDHHPGAAFDADPGTAWVTGGVEPLGQWVQGRSQEPLPLDAVRLQVPLVRDLPGRAARVLLTTDRGSVEADVPTGGSRRVPLPAGTTRSLRATVLETSGLEPSGGLGAVALEVVPLLAGGEPLVVRRTLVVPPVPEAAEGPVVLAFEAARRTRGACVPIGDRRQCGPDLLRGDEDDTALDRTFTLATPALYGAGVRARVRGGEALDALLQQGQAVQVSGSSRAYRDPTARPAAALDRDLRTAWLASPFDRAPALSLDLGQRRRVSGVVLSLDEFVPAARPLRVVVDAGGRRQEVELDADGSAALPVAVDARRLTVAVTASQRRTTARVDGLRQALPVGVTELQVLDPRGRDLAAARLDERRSVALPCGRGPVLEADGRVVAQTSATATAGALLAGGEVQVEACGGPVALTAGEHRVRLAQTAELLVTGLVLTELGRPSPVDTARRTTDVQRWDATARTVSTGPGAQAWLGVDEAFNEGWTAELDGRRLPAARLDGWKQGFLLPAGPGGQVRLRFPADDTYRSGLLAGLLAAVVLLALAAVPGARAPSRAPLAAALPRQRRRRAGAPLAVLAVLVAGGVAAAGALVLAGAVVLLARRRRPTAHRRPAALLAVAGPAGLLLAGLLVVARPWPQDTLLSAPVQALAVLAPVALALSLLGRGPGHAAAAPAPRPPSAKPRPTRRWPGRRRR